MLVPKIMLSNVQRLYNKMDELNARISSERDLWNVVYSC